jgi:pSer/pThr/pTyr-binding forkhead associated (FHA) protein
VAGVFHLKLITQRAGGGDPIIREREVAGPTLNLGRETDNDIVLADLAIDPRHARATLTGPG